MRSLLLLLAGTALAHAGPTLATLVVDAKLLGAPRADGVDAGIITRGTSVIVHHEEGDWLAIQPPRGSVSWIGHLFLEFPDKTPNAGFPKNAVVRSEGEVKLAVGRAGHARPLDVRKTSIPEGTIVLVIGPAVKTETDSTTWYPIVAPEDDFRYLPKSSVQFAGSGGGTFTVKTPATSNGPIPVPAAVAALTPVARAGWPNHTLWVQAEQAEQAGDLEKAERLYLQLAKEMNSPGGDGELANLCYSRVHAIREKRRQGTGKKENWSTSMTASPTGPPKVNDDFTPRLRNEPLVERSEKVAEPRGQWTGTGFLRRAGFKVGSKQAYALEDPRGKLLYYAISTGSFEIEKFHNRTVDLFGTITTPKDFRGVALVEVSKIDQVK